MIGILLIIISIVQYGEIIMFNFIITIIIIIIISFYLFKYIAKKFYFINIYLLTILSYSFILLLLFAIVFNPERTISSVLDSIDLYIRSVFPSLFPFFVVSELLISLGFVHFISVFLEPIMRPLFNVPGSGSFSFIIGIISGYPVGAKTVVNLKENKLCSKTEAERLLTFCNNSGPLFILGSVAIGMFHNTSLGLLFFLSHILASLSVAFCFRFYKLNDNNNNRFKKNYNIDNISLKRLFGEVRKVRQKDDRNFGEILGDSIKNSINSLLMISGFIIFFTLLINLMDHFKIIDSLAKFLKLSLNLFNLNSELIAIGINGLFEITSAINRIASPLVLASYLDKLVMTSLILGWGGLSVHCQVISIISKSNISIVPYIIGKLLQGSFSAVYTFLLVKFLPINLPIFNTLNNNIDLLASQSILKSVYLSLMLLGNFLLLIASACILSLLYISRKNKGHH